MTGYFVSLLTGVAAGVAYGLVQVRSPAPPLIALVGLLGMVLGEHAIVAARCRFAPTSTCSDVQARPGLTAAASAMQTLPGDGHTALVADVARTDKFKALRGDTTTFDLGSEALAARPRDVRDTDLP
jgi:XapX domain-containing protein